VTFSDYDAMGNVGRMQNGVDDLRYRYDNLGRRDAILDMNEGERPIKEYLYDAAVGSGLGKVYKAVRHNYSFYPWSPSQEQDVVVTETMRYEGRRGRVSQRDTVIEPLGYEYSQTFEYDDVGRVVSLGYPSCSGLVGCPQSSPVRDLEYAFSYEKLGQIVGWTGAISYHLNGMWNEIPRDNGVTDVQVLWGNNLSRPKRLTTTGASPNWNSGNYSYDGAGNIKERGSEAYVYDGAMRLIEGTAAGYHQAFDYDPFGNLETVATTDPLGITTTQANPLEPATNRLTSATYDAAGRALSWATESYDYDALGQIRHMNNKEWTYIYTADEERIYTMYQEGNPSSAERTISIRDLSGNVLRRFEAIGWGESQWQWEGDYVYKAGQLIGSEHNGGGIRHYHSDHLGTPHLITDGQGQSLGDHAYLPYGIEITDPGQEGTVFKFTGHERDQHGSGTLDDLDYMHARYYSPHLGRFMRPDPELGKLGSPQSWNRYAYALGNPIRFGDPTGRISEDGVGEGTPEKPTTDDEFEDEITVTSTPWDLPGADDVFDDDGHRLFGTNVPGWFDYLASDDFEDFDPTAKLHELGQYVPENWAEEAEVLGDPDARNFISCLWNKSRSQQMEWGGWGVQGDSGLSFLEKRGFRDGSNLHVDLGDSPPEGAVFVFHTHPPGRTRTASQPDNMLWNTKYRDVPFFLASEDGVRMYMFGMARDPGILFPWRFLGSVGDSGGEPCKSIDKKRLK